MKTTLLILFVLFILVGKNFSQPSLISPSNGGDGVSTSPTITWSKVTNANAYYLKVTTGNPQDPNIFDGNVGNNTSKNISKLINNTMYYVQLWSSTNGGTNWSAGSSIYSFRTEVAYTEPIHNSQVYYTPPNKASDAKTTGVKAGIVFPIGVLSNNYGMGFTIADISKWYLSKYVRALGRLELTFVGGKDIQKELYPGYTYTYTNDPFGILTAGSGFEFSFDYDDGIYGIVDFPSLNIIIMNNTALKAGFGVGIGFESSLGKALFGLELRANLYNAFLIQNRENAIAGAQLNFEVEY